MASGLVQKTVGDGNSGTFAATFLSSDGTGSGHPSAHPDALRLHRSRDQLSPPARLALLQAVCRRCRASLA